MADLENIDIIEEPNEFDDHFLDLIGRSFNFSHPKGLSEWLKNSVDAYIRDDISDSDQHIIFRFTRKENLIFEMIDFSGMTNLDIQKAFKRWGDPDASKRGMDKVTYGGHGNGGKFYMRQMFDKSYFVTYRDGHLNVFGFNENKKYGFLKGYENKKVEPEQALEIAEINNINFPKGVKELILNDKCGFTVVRGIKPKQKRGKINPKKVIKKFKNHPQSRRILSRINFWVSYGEDDKEYDLVRPDALKPLPEFSEPKVVDIPEVLTFEEDGEKITVEMANDNYDQGKLIIKTSAEAFGRGSYSEELNRIDFVGELGVIASYKMLDLGVQVFPQASFLYGECKCPILEDPEMDCVENDRDKLTKNDRSEALKNWVRDQIDDFADEIAAKERKEQKEKQKKISSAYNDLLNNWKDKFMGDVVSDILTGGDDEGEGKSNKSQKKKKLEKPKTGLEFSYSKAKLVVDNPKRITLKASVPDPLPIGSIISLKSTNDFIEISEDQITIESDNVKSIPSGDMVAVLNFEAAGRRKNEKGNIVASAGDLEASIELYVKEKSSGSDSKNPRKPKVLLSGRSEDPLGMAPGGTVTLGERDPVVYQRPQDVSEGIYWINTQSPLANRILDKWGDQSVRWRDYLFQRYIDIFLKEAIYKIQKQDPESFRAEIVDNKINELVKRVHSDAVRDLKNFLFDEEFDPMAPKDNKS